MFFGHIEQVEMRLYPVAIQKALCFLQQTDFSQLKTGRYEIDGDRIYAQVLDLVTKDQATILPEVHRRYLDVQFLYSGTEKIGIAVDNGQCEIAQGYDEKKDILFYQDVPDESILTLYAGNFAVFFPTDIHRPACINKVSSSIRKVVVKIAINQIL